MGPSNSPSQDVAVVGGHVLGRGRTATSVAVRGGRIVHVGSDAETLEVLGSDAIVIDAAGGTIMPGFDDAHAHFLSGAALRGTLALDPRQSLDEVRTAVSEYSTRGEGWVTGSGWHYSTFGGSTPDRIELDRLTHGRPAFLTAFDGHTAWVNGAALRIAGVDASTPDPDGGTIDRDTSGEPTGIIRERATRLFHPHLPRPRGSELIALATESMHDLAAMGITAVQDPGTEPEDLAIWRQLRDDGHLRVRARLGLPLPAGIRDEDFLLLLDSYATALTETTDACWLSGGILKGFVDGVIETRTAAMLQPYVNDEARGELLFASERLSALVAIADGRGWQVQLHAIGDRAVRISLDAIEFAQTIRTSGIRHRIEHLEVCDPADIARFAALEAIASIQPLHADCDPGRVEAWDGLLGAARSEMAWPSADILRTGGIVALGSDWPVASCAPLDILGAAVSTSNSTVGGAPSRSNSLDLAAALSAYTRGSAIAARAEERRGRIAVGFDADITVLDKDLTLADIDGAEAVELLSHTVVRATIAAGRITYRC